MISFCGCKVDLSKRFPDGTSALRMSEEVLECLCKTARPQIVWRYENDAEFLQLVYITDWIRSLSFDSKIELVLPYIPNARNDRVQNAEDVFTLKSFCRLINDLQFIRVSVMDPHSHVVCGLLDRIDIIKPDAQIASVIDAIEENTGETIALFYPDEGSMKRYSGLWKNSIVEDHSRPYAFGVKKRDWETGNIQGLQLMQVENIVGKNVLIIDDICSRGGTFYHSAKALKDAGAKQIFLWVTHCENTILQGDLINMPEVSIIYTTDSIFTGSHDKIIKLKI